MANEVHLAVLRQGVEAWNAWRQAHPAIRPDLSGAYLRRADLSDVLLSGADLRGANLRKADLSRADLDRADLGGANLRKADFSEASLRGANLDDADLSRADLGEADLSGAYLRRARLSGAYLRETKLCEAHLERASLRRAVLVETDLTKADLTGCCVYGMSAWDLNLEGATQQDLVVTPADQPEITVDNLEVAQFIYLLLKNEKLRDAIDTVTAKAVLILGRFTSERKVVLDTLREELRQRNYLPILFDFDKPANKDLTGTIQTLANMARFVIADLTDPSSVPYELATIAPSTVVPIQAILAKSQREFAMFPDLQRRYHWVLEPYRYASPERLLTDLGKHVIAPAEAKARELHPPASPLA